MMRLHAESAGLKKLIYYDSMNSFSSERWVIPQNLIILQILIQRTFPKGNKNAHFLFNVYWKCIHTKVIISSWLPGKKILSNHIFFNYSNLCNVIRILKTFFWEKKLLFLRYRMPMLRPSSNSPLQRTLECHTSKTEPWWQLRCFWEWIPLFSFEKTEQNGGNNNKVFFKHLNTMLKYSLKIQTMF